MSQKLAIIGFGTVGQGFVEILVRDSERLKAEYGVDFKVVAISDVAKGTLAHADGLNLTAVLESVETSGNFMEYPNTQGLVKGWDSVETILNSGADTVIEATFTNIIDGQPGIEHCRKALEAGKNVVTTNKGPIALALDELEGIAAARGVRILYEGTVMSGTPVLRLAATGLAGNQIQGIRGILNGTSNYILTRMEEGLTFTAALAEAQRWGYAEADPTNDVDGFDAQYKLLILARALFGSSLRREDILCTGIRAITSDDIARAREDGKRYKLVASLERDPSGLIGRVMPEAVALSDPLAGVAGAINALTYRCDLSGDVTIVGAGAGRLETGYALLIDCLNLYRGQI